MSKVRWDAVIPYVFIAAWGFRDSRGVEVLPSCCWLYTHRLMPGHFAFYGLAPDKWRDAVWWTQYFTGTNLILEARRPLFSVSGKKHYFLIPKLGTPFWPCLRPASGHLRDAESRSWLRLHSSMPPLATPMLAVGSELDTWREGMNWRFPDRYYSQVVEGTAKSVH